MPLSVDSRQRLHQQEMFLRGSEPRRHDDSTSGLLPAARRCGREIGNPVAHEMEPPAANDSEALTQAEVVCRYGDCGSREPTEPPFRSHGDCSARPLGALGERPAVCSEDCRTALASGHETGEKAGNRTVRVYEIGIERAKFALEVSIPAQA